LVVLAWIGTEEDEIVVEPPSPPLVSDPEVKNRRIKVAH
jgi:hypothetical protein